MERSSRGIYSGAAQAQPRPAFDQLGSSGEERVSLCTHPVIEQECAEHLRGLAMGLGTEAKMVHVTSATTDRWPESTQQEPLSSWGLGGCKGFASSSIKWARKAAVRASRLDPVRQGVPRVRRGSGSE